MKAKKKNNPPRKMSKRYNVPGAPMSNKDKDRISRLAMDDRIGKAMQKDAEVPNPGLGSRKVKRKNTFVGDFEMTKTGNPGGLKKKAFGGGKFGDPIKRAQRKAKRKMRKDSESIAFGPTRKTKRQQKRGLRQMRKQQLR
jgi:hypothetical protein